MQDSTTIPPVEETLTAQVNVRLTPSEKQDVGLVALFDKQPESTLMREFRIQDIRDRAEAIRTGRAVSRAA